MRHVATLTFALIAAFGLTGATCARKPTPPVVIRVPVEVTRTVYVPIDASLTAPCPIALPRNRKGSETLRVNRERRAALADCDARMTAIRSVQGTEVKP